MSKSWILKSSNLLTFNVTDPSNSFSNKQSEKMQQKSRTGIVKNSIKNLDPNIICERHRRTHTFLIRASVDVLVTKYECITLYGWIPLAALKLFKCMQPWSLISGWQDQRQHDRTSSPSSSPFSYLFFSPIPNIRWCRRQSLSRSCDGTVDATHRMILRLWQ